MSPNLEVTVEGTLRADGTVELHEKPHLAPGPVTVILVPPSVLVPASGNASPRGSIAETIGQIKARQQRRGYHGYGEVDFEQLEKERQADEEAYDDRWKELLDPDQRSKG